MKLSREDIHIIIGALNSLGIALVEYNHIWTNGQRSIYEEAIKILDPCSSTDSK